MEQGKSEKATNENIDPQAVALGDLPLTGEQADDSKAGTGGRQQQEYFKIIMSDVLIS